MASTSRPQDDRSAGGKILRGRRNPRPSPYDRPSPAPPAPSPNWFTGIVLPKIATGAASILSSFISSPDDSEDSDSSDDEEDVSADNSDESTHPHYFIDEVDVLNKEDASTPELDKSRRKELQSSTGKSEAKHLIEKLIVQETFSREERDNIMRIIDSRVIGSSTKNEGLVTGSDDPDFCKAIMEAKQWIEEKKGSISKTKRSHEISTPTTVVLQHDAEGGSSSPVDIAKAYMLNRPPWSSPLLNSLIEKTPSRVGSDVLNDEAPHDSPFSSSKRKFSSGSWSIQDEIRRVRSKATEDMLKAVPSQKNSLSSISIEPEGNSLPNGKLGSDLGGGSRDSNLFTSVKSKDASSNLTAAGVNTSGGLLASAVDTVQDGIQTEALRLQPITRAQIERVENIQMIEKDKYAADGSSHSAIPEPISKDGFRLKEKSCPTADGDVQTRGKATDSGYSSSRSREVENNHQHSDGKDPTAVCSSHDKSAGRKSLEETCELLSETSVEIPGVDDAAVDISLSQLVKNSEESSSKQLTRQPKQVVKGKSAKVGTGQGRKLRPKGRAT